MTRLFRCTAPAAAAFALVFAAGAQAQSNVQIYGLVDMSAGRFQTSGAPAVYRADSGNMSTSYLGFKGTEDLGGGLKAKFAIEHFLRLDSGSAGRFNGDAFWARSAYVGLQGAFGSSTLGRNTTPLFVSELIFNAFGDSFGFSPTIRQVFTPSLPSRPFFGDTGWNNSLAYSSPSTGGASFNLLGNLGEGSAGSTGKNVSANVLYFAGPLSGTLAWQRVHNGMGGTVPAFFRYQDAWNAGAAYDLTVVKLYAQFTQVKTKAAASNRTTINGFGAAVPLGAGKLLGQYGFAKSTIGGLKTTHKNLTTGYDYNLSKSTDVYAVYMYDKISRQEKGQTVAAGVRLRF